MSAFLSHRDAANLLNRCIRVTHVQHAVVHGISNNRYKRLSLEETTRLLDYYPEDDAFTLLGFSQRAQHAAPLRYQPREGRSAVHHITAFQQSCADTRYF